MFQTLLNQPFIRYCLIGSFSALVDWTIFYFLAIFLDVYYLFSATISFVIAVFFNYFVGIRFLFTSEIRFSKNKEIFLVFVVSSIGLIINLFALFIFSSVLYIGLMLSKILASFFTVFWNFIGRNNYVFKEIR